MDNTTFSKGDFKKGRADQAIRKKQLKQLIAGGVLAVIGIAIIISVMWGGTDDSSGPGSAPGSAFESVGAEHIGLLTTPPNSYNSNPPSSGAHFAVPGKWEIYDYEVNDKIFIHNLEHGGIWIAYRPTISQETIDELKAIVNEFSGGKIVMAPRSANESDVAIVAWTRVFAFDISDGRMTEEQKNNIRAFYKTYLNRGPEFVPASMQGVDPKAVEGGEVHPPERVQ